MSRSFLKMSGAGNDFLVLDDRQGDLAGLGRERWQALCARRTGVGADGVLLLGTSRDADFRMVYLNSDGGEAQMCGNGARCLAWAAATEFGAAGRMGPSSPRPPGFQAPEGSDRQVYWATSFVASDGRHDAIGSGRTVLVSLGDPSPVSERHLETGAGSFEASLLTVGVPHLVVRVQDTEAAPLAEAGPLLRSHPDLGPAGANVDFLATRPGEDGCWRMRTFERGVEAETLACGTGAASVGVLLALAGEPSPVAVRTSSAEVLRVHFRHRAGRVADLWLEGPVTLVYRGELPDL